MIDSPKMTRETLCVAQTLIGIYGGDRRREHLSRLQRMIDEIDIVRPLGPDGTHGDRHTDRCGCDA